MSNHYKNLLLIALLFISTVAAGQKIPEKQLNVLQVKAKGFADAPKKVFIKNFKIYYQMIAEAEKTSYGGRQFGGGSYTGDATARLAVGVEGVTGADLQTLTNGIYEDYLANLKNQGLEVYTSKDFPNMEAFAESELLEGPRINQEQIKGLYSLQVSTAYLSYQGKNLMAPG